jgi:hypothetical protein
MTESQPRIPSLPLIAGTESTYLCAQARPHLIGDPCTCTPRSP